MFGSKHYVGYSVNNVVDYLNKQGKFLPEKALTPMTNGYRPEINISPEIGTKDAAYYHSLIGVLRWVVDLGRVEINAEALLLSWYIAMPRGGHLEDLLHNFAYLNNHMNSEIVFDASIPDFDMNYFNVSIGVTQYTLLHVTCWKKL